MTPEGQRPPTAAGPTRKPRNATDAPGDTGTDEGTGTNGAPPPPPTQEWRKPRGQLGDIHDAIETLLGGVALGFYTAGDFHCYTVLAERGPLVAQTWTEAADKNPQVKRVLMRLVEGGAWGQVMFATASVVIPILDHHGAWPLPNPWMILTTPLDHNAPPDTGSGAAHMPPDRGDVDSPDAADIAERQRREAEEARKRRTG